MSDLKKSDLKKSSDDEQEPAVQPAITITPMDNDVIDFNQLKLVESPTSERNSKSLPETLDDCIGHMKRLPLKAPNANQKQPQTVVDMINALTIPGADEEYEARIQQQGHGDYDDYLDDDINAASADLTSRYVVNSKEKSSHWKTFPGTGHIVRPGCISLYQNTGKTYAVGEGRWWLLSLISSWTKHKNINLDQDTISLAGTQVLIVRVLIGEVGLVMEQGKPRLLDVGTHVYNSGTVQFLGKKKYITNDHFSHGPYHYLRVPRGKYAKVWAEVNSNSAGVEALVPRLLAEGEHYICSNLFGFNGFVNVGDEYISHGAVKYMSVPKGSVAKIIQDNEFRLLGEGNHVVESTNFEYKGLSDVVRNLCTVHGTITIFRVPLGQIALAWNKNQPLFIDKPGLYEFNSEDFNFVEYKGADERHIELGAKKIIQVYTGEVGISYEKGELRILDNGRHVINSSTHIFQRFLSTKQKSIRLMSLDADEKKRRSKESKRTADSTRATSTTRKSGRHHDVLDSEYESDMTICETKDLVKVGVRADVFYSIADPEKCIMNIDTEELEDLVRETAIATLTNIIRSTALNQIAQSKHVSAYGTQDQQFGGAGTLEAFPKFEPSSANTQQFFTSSSTYQQQQQQQQDQQDLLSPADDDGAYDDEDEILQAAPMFFDRAHDEFMAKLHDDFMERYGVDIANIRIEAFKIVDTELAEQISKQALTTAQVENELANLEGQTIISVQKERTKAEVQNINAEAEATSLKTRADAQNRRKIDASRAAAESLRIEKQSEADTILMKAKAEAEAIRLKAMAEAERAKLLSETTLGQKESLLGIYSDMVKKSSEGVEKVVYMDSNVNNGSPFALASLDNLRRDLHSLSALGIAAGESKGSE